MSNRPTTIETISMESIRTDGGTQIRARINEEVVSDYAQLYHDGAPMPPIELVYEEGVGYWLIDGWHRYWAVRQLTQDDLHAHITAEVWPGTREEAVYAATSRNKTHGLRRTKSDRNKAIYTILTNPEWAEASNYQIAAHVGVDEKTVRIRRHELHQQEDENMEEARKGPRAASQRDEDRQEAESSDDQKQPERPHIPGEPAKIVDRNGLEVPDHLRPAFERAHEMDGIASQARRIVTAINSLKRDRVLGAHINGSMAAAANSYAKKLGNVLSQVKPAFICDDCSGSGTAPNGGRCHKCRASGWVPEAYIRAPEPQKQEEAKE